MNWSELQSELLCNSNHIICFYLWELNSNKTLADNSKDWLLKILQDLKLWRCVLKGKFSGKAEGPILGMDYNTITWRWESFMWKRDKLLWASVGHGHKPSCSDADFMSVWVCVSVKIMNVWAKLLLSARPFNSLS